MHNDPASGPSEQPLGSLGRTHENRPGLPRGRSSLSSEEVGSAQRDRLVRAMIAATAEQGYPAVMIADVVRRARVSRKAFYAHFADKQACFLAAADLGVALMFRRVAEAVAAVGEAPEPLAPLRAGLGAYLRFLAGEPEFARVFLVEGLAAGPAALERFAAAHRRFAELTRRWYEAARTGHPDWAEAPDAAYTAVIGALHELVAVEVRARRTAALPELEGTVLRVHRALLMGWPGGAPDREG
ncbi:TetR/AcrR family transcriptional regulator [Streptomyces physcomitrii]|uniref:TetR/AcrR family transcriptional regulator n=1 Tax=Streptomyces physcomitrii TaxID=2724184 RepID=A0ABX1H1S7_9ACTN|nr:TetR/AcrR family transcriptional regulator [Streptomyces physcomitrii]NKI42007.1 TetR/AcrR family transcriptional regulator [Streptomyces physcomitrii]